jgi:hypothetical protein
VKLVTAAHRLFSAPPDCGAERNRAAFAVVLALLLSVGLIRAALGKDADDDSTDTSGKPASEFPNVYLDLRTIYTTLPANTLAIGFSSPALLAALPGMSTPSSRSVQLDAPLTVDMNDRVSVYGGVSASTSQLGAGAWTALAITSWNMGLQADIYKQNGGVIPTITVQGTVTKSVPDAPLATTTYTTLVEADYALNEDETRGLLAGIQYTRVNVNTSVVSVDPTIVGYLGAYHQWDTNWKLSGRVGVQSFGGAQLLDRTPILPFTQPIVRVDLDRMDDSDNRLFGLTAQMSWTPKPAYQLTLRTPLYAVRN